MAQKNGNSLGGNWVAIGWQLGCKRIGRDLCALRTRLTPFIEQTLYVTIRHRKGLSMIYLAHESPPRVTDRQRTEWGTENGQRRESAE
jgi:hypothetical protein